MAVTRRVKISRRWPGGKLILWEAWGERRCQVERQYRTVFRRARFSISPKRIVIYVQKASCCDRKGVSTTRTSEVSWLIATRLESATARLASANPSAAQKTRAAAVDCYGEWRIPQFWRFEKRWPLQ